MMINFGQNEILDERTDKHGGGTNVRWDRLDDSVEDTLGIQTEWRNVVERLLDGVLRSSTWYSCDITPP